MTTEVTKTVVDVGLIEVSTLDELHRWGYSVPTPSPIQQPDPLLIPSLIEHAMQTEEYVSVKETDLEIMQQFNKTQSTGELHIDGLSEDDAFLPVTFGRSLLGDYIFPWQTAKDLAEWIVAPDTYLVCSGENGEKQVRFKRAKDMYFGDEVVFVVCTPE